MKVQETPGLEMAMPHAGLAPANARAATAFCPIERESSEADQGEQGGGELPGRAQQLQSLAQRLVNDQDTERRRLSRELHDLIGQNLTALSINLDIVRAELPAGARDRVLPRMDEMRSLIEATIDSVRSVMSELQPAALDECGLDATLHQYAARFREATGCQVSVSADPSRGRLSRDAELALFRIVQEALANVARHSQSQFARVVVRASPGGVVTTVQDYGRGFMMTRQDDERRSQQRGWGLMIMRERALAAGGRLWIETEPGAGTRVIVEVPGGAPAP